MSAEQKRLEEIKRRKEAEIKRKVALEKARLEKIRLAKEAVIRKAAAEKAAREKAERERLAKIEFDKNVKAAKLSYKKAIKMKMN